MQKMPVSGERRLISLFKTLGENLKTYANDLNQNYLSGPWRNRDPIQKVLGPVIAGGSLLLEGTDQLWAGVVDQRIERPSGIAGRTRRDLKLLLKDVVTLHPLRAIGDIFRLGFADLPLDAGDAIGGFRMQSRNRYASTLNAASEPEYRMAA